jgi:hypothetical protein
MITEAAIAFCVSMGVQCKTMDDVIQAYQATRPSNVLWLSESLVVLSGNESLEETIRLYHTHCPTQIILLGSEPYNVWLCLRPEGTPIS